MISRKLNGGLICRGVASLPDSGTQSWFEGSGGGESVPLERSLILTASPFPVGSWFL